MHGAKINCTAIDGSTPLAMAIQNEHKNIVKYLIKHGALDKK